MKAFCPIFNTIYVNIIPFSTNLFSNCVVPFFEFFQPTVWSFKIMLIQFFDYFSGFSLLNWPRYKQFLRSSIDKLPYNCLSILSNIGVFGFLQVKEFSLLTYSFVIFSTFLMISYVWVFLDFNFLLLIICVCCPTFQSLYFIQNCQSLLGFIKNAVRSIHQ